MAFTRKDYLKAAAIINYIFTGLFLFSFIGVIINFNGVRDSLIDMVHRGEIETSMEANAFINAVLVYMFTCIVGNGVFGTVYYRYSKYNVALFFKTKKSLLNCAILNIFIGFAVFSFPLVLTALLLKPTAAEIKEVEALKKSLVHLQNVLQAKEVAEVKNENTAETPNVFINVESIEAELNKLRIKKANQELSDEEFKKEVNLLLEKNIKS